MKEKSFFRQLLETVVGLAIIAIAAMMFLNSPAQGGSTEINAVKVHVPQATLPPQATATQQSAPTDLPAQEVVAEVATDVPVTETPVPTAVPPTNTPVPTLAPSDGSAQGQLWYSCNNYGNCNTLDNVMVIVRQDGRQQQCDMPSVEGHFV